MPCESFSSTSDSKALLGWLEAILEPGPFCELGGRRGRAGDEEKMSVLRFLAEDGDDGGMFWRVRDSPSTRFWGNVVMMRLSEAIRESKKKQAEDKEMKQNINSSSLVACLGQNRL